MTVPAADEIFLDLDTDAAAARMARGSEILAKAGFQFEMLVHRQSKSGWPHKHAILRITAAPLGFGPPLTPVHRVLLQALLGSDLAREALSLVEILTGSDRPTTCLFEDRPNPREVTRAEWDGDRG